LNAKVFTKSAFQKFSLPHYDGNYFLRPDRILAAFVVDHNNLPKMSNSILRLLDNEIQYDQISVERLNDLEAVNKFNTMRVNKAVINYNAIADAGVMQQNHEESRSRSRSGASSPHSGTSSSSSLTRGGRRGGGGNNSGDAGASPRLFGMMRFARSPEPGGGDGSFKQAVEMVEMALHGEATLDGEEEDAEEVTARSVEASFGVSDLDAAAAPGSPSLSKNISNKSTSSSGSGGSGGDRQRSRSGSGSSPGLPRFFLPQLLRSTSQESATNNNDNNSLGRTSSVESPRLDFSDLYARARGRSRTNSATYLTKDPDDGGTMV
jgi:hypothetical protein